MNPRVRLRWCAWPHGGEVRVEARKLGQLVAGDEQADALIDSFVQLQAAILSHPHFSKFTVTRPSDNMIRLKKDSQCIEITCLKTRHDPEPLDPALFPRQCRVYFLEPQEGEEPSAPASGQSLPENYQALPARTNLRAVIAYIENLLSLQGQFARWESEKRAIETTSADVKQMLSISRELNGERNIDKLLSLILKKAREVTGADAGSIYTLEKASTDIRDWTLNFRFTQNDSITQNLSQFTMPVTEYSIVGNAVIHQQPINIPDLYELSDDPGQNPFGARHDKSWDRRSGYESHSMLTLPVFNIAHEVTGIIQLINRKKEVTRLLREPADFGEVVIPFDERDIEYGLIVGQQAGIALENAAMTEEIQRLFDGFVNASVTAIEQRDPTTSGHSFRVASLTVELAKVVSGIETGIYAGVGFTPDQLKEIEYASLLHDFGKLGVSEQVLVKAKKLYPWEFDVMHQRFEYIRAMIEVEYLTKRVELNENPYSFPDGYDVRNLVRERDDRLRKVDDFFFFVKNANEPTILEQGGFERLNEISANKYRDLHGKWKPYLLDNELAALSVAKGSLTREEFAIIQSHVSHTYEFLRKIPWGTRLANIPNIAAKHHEYLNGSGYPHGARGDQIPMQTRMMTIADIFDALTASDRPYKKALPFEKAIDILHMEVKSGKVDGQLLEVFVQASVFNVIKTD